MAVTVGAIARERNVELRWVFPVKHYKYNSRAQGHMMVVRVNGGRLYVAHFFVQYFAEAAPFKCWERYECRWIEVLDEVCKVAGDGRIFNEARTIGRAAYSRDSRGLDVPEVRQGRCKLLRVVVQE